MLGIHQRVIQNKLRPFIRGKNGNITQIPKRILPHTVGGGVCSITAKIKIVGPILVKPNRLEDVGKLREEQTVVAIRVPPRAVEGTQ